LGQAGAVGDNPSTQWLTFRGTLPVTAGLDWTRRK